MQDLIEQIDKLQDEVNDACRQLKVDRLAEELKQLQTKAQDPHFWDDNKSAQANMKKQSKLEGRIKPWQELKRSLIELKELAEIGDASIAKDMTQQLKHASRSYETLKSHLKLSGEYDTYDAIVSLYAGAGGTDAQDWTQMLLRMYVRWASLQGYELRMIDESAGDEAGIKSATFEVSGNYAYGKLRSENGVHRLVRLSPFNSDNLRQTSFAKVEVMPKIDQPDALEIDEKDLKIDVYRSGGKGGQSVNTTDSAVRITHIPTGVVVAIQNERSQLQNKETAMTILRSRLAQLQLEQHQQSLKDLKGPNEQAAWGNQIRSYVLHPYKQVKDLRTGHESTDPNSVLDGDIDSFIDAYLEYTAYGKKD